MRIGVPREIKDSETRVALTPHGARELTAAGHEVLVEAGAGLKSSFTDDEYRASGAIVTNVTEAWAADLVLKVKEPLESEYPMLRDNALFTFLHLAANPELARALCTARTLGLSYDTVQAADGSLPLLAPMSAVAGKLAILVGAYHLQTHMHGRGVLLAGVTGVFGASVVVLGAGVAGSHAVEQAVAMGARVTVLDISEPALERLERQYGEAVRCEISRPDAVAEAVGQADLVIGAVLVAGQRAPVVVTHQMVLAMKPGSVLVDIAIDQGGCFEDSRPTTHTDPVFTVGGSQLYCVANMPGAVGLTSTTALTHATLPYVVELAAGFDEAISRNPALAAGVNTRDGAVVHPRVRAALESE